VPEQSERRTQQQRRADTERRVIDAATELIAARGSRAVTLGEVGRAAGYSRGIVHSHFGSREQLLEAVVRAAQQFPVPEVPGPGLDRLGAVVRAYVANLSARTPATGAFLLLWSESIAGEPGLEALFGERDTSFRADLAALVRAGVDDGSVRADADPDAVAVLLLGLLRGIGMQLASATGAEIDDAIAARTADFVTAGLRAPH
jgi:AcrR family transcriptional regulator